MNIKIFMIMSGILLWFLFSVAAVSYIIGVLFREIKSRKEKKRFEECLKSKRIKCKALCNACKYEHYCADRSNDCRACGQYAGEKFCKCYEIEYGEKCPYFKPFESEA